MYCAALANSRLERLHIGIVYQDPYYYQLIVMYGVPLIFSSIACTLYPVCWVVRIDLTRRYPSSHRIYCVAICLLDYHKKGVDKVVVGNGRLCIVHIHYTIPCQTGEVFKSLIRKSG